VDYAHNDYLQLLVETGLVGVIVLVWAVVGLLVYVLGRWVGRKDPFVRGLVMGGLGALTAVLAHSATDFGLHMPANALLVVALGALLPAVVSLRLHRAGYRVDLPEWRLPLSSLTSRAVTTAILVAGIVVAGMPVPRAMAARYRASDVDQPWSAAQSVLARAYDDLRVATRLDPRNPEYQGTLAAVTTELAGRAWGYGVTPEGRRVPISTPLDRLRASQELWGTACAAYEDGLRSRPRDPGLLERFGSFLGRLERVRRSVNGQPLAGPLPDCLARVLGTDTSILPLAVEQFRRAVRWEPNNAERHRSLALFVLAHRNDVANAPETIASALRGALSLERSMLGDIADRLLAPPSADLDLLWASMPRQVPVMLDLAWQLERRGRAAAATAALEKALAIAIDPELQKDVRVAHGRLLLTRDDVTGAIAQLRHALVLAPGNPDVFAALGEAYESGRRWSEAESAFTSAVSLAEDASPQQANVHRNRLAGYLTRRGDLDRALVLRELVARDTPADPWAHVEIGKLLEQRGEWGLAFRKYQEAERLGAKSSDVSAWVARTYARRGLLREAVVAYENAVHLAPRLADVRAELGELYSRTGRPEQAVQQFRQILATHPNHEAARRGLTSVIVQSTASSKE
jgi:tetratricopeptide (TPR) repeat protein